MFKQEETHKRFTFFEKSSNEDSKNFAESYIRKDITKISFTPDFENFPKFKDYSKFNTIEIPETTKIFDANHFLKSELQSPLTDFTLRTLSVQTTQFSLHTLQEEILRSKAMVNINMALDAPNTLFGPNKIILGATKTPIGQIGEWMNYVDLELRNLYNQASPIGKATLPTQLIIKQNHPRVLELISRGEYLNAKHVFAEEVFHKYHLDTPVLDKLKFVGRGLGIASATTVAYKIGTSEDKLAAAEQEVVTFAGGFAAGMQAGKLALPYCSKLVHPVAKTVCQAGAVLVGSIVGTEATNNIYQKAVHKKDEEGDKLLSNTKHSTFFKPVPESKNTTIEFSRDVQVRDSIKTMDEFFEDYKESSLQKALELTAP